NGQSPDIYIPLNRTGYCCARGAGGLGVVVRLKDRATRAQFQRELEARSQALAAEFAATNRDVRFVASDLDQFLLGDRRRLVDWLLASVATLISIAIAN